MKKWLYILYLIVVFIIVAVAGAEERDDRDWYGGTGRSGWSSGGGHK